MTEVHRGNIFIAVSRQRGQQLKERAQFDGFLRDGSEAYTESLCQWTQAFWILDYVGDTALTLRGPSAKIEPISVEGSRYEETQILEYEDQ